MPFGSVMRTDRPSLRAVLALLLAGSAILFFVGIYLERGMTASTAPAVVQASAAPASAPPVEGSGGEAGEAGRSSGASAPDAAEGSGKTAGEHATETWPLGIDLEAAPLVGGVIVVSLALAGAVAMTTSPVVLVVIVGFAVLFGLFDLLEVAHQVGRLRPVSLPSRSSWSRPMPPLRSLRCACSRSGGPRCHRLHG
jgi:hypothetical protein